MVSPAPIPTTRAGPSKVRLFNSEFKAVSYLLWGRRQISSLTRTNLFLSDIEKGGSFFVADDRLVVVGRGRVVNLWVVAHSHVVFCFLSFVFCLLSFVFLRLISLDVGHLQQGGQP